MAKVAILIDRNFNDAALRHIYDRFEKNGHALTFVGPRAGDTVAGREGTFNVTIEVAVDDLRPSDLDALVVPPGFRRDHLRTHERLLNFIRDAYAYGKPVGLVREDGWVLVRADPQGRAAATWPAIKRDLLLESTRRAREGFEREALIASDVPDVNAFCDAMLAQIEKGPREETTRALAGPAANDPVEATWGPAPAESPHPVD